MKKLKLLSLFSGIGGFELGLERSGGFETVAQCEIEEYPRKVLAKHWPGVPCYEEVRTLNAVTLQRDGIEVDAICGGFPCQDLSACGSGEGLQGPRSGLWSELFRLIRELLPKIVIVENSPNLLRGNNGDWALELFGQLSSIGYDAEWDVIPASYVAAPHKRERAWIIAYPAGFRSSRQGKLVQSINSTPDAYREANRLVDAFYEGAMPFVCRGHDGVSQGMDRLKALGNAVVPQIPELIGRSIMDSMPELFK